jgi:hypothetical protein
MREEVWKVTDAPVVLHGVDFSPRPGVDILDHVKGQLVDQQRALTSDLVVAVFGDGGAGVFLSAVDDLARDAENDTGKVSDIRGNAFFLAPGGTYNHASQFLGTHELDALRAFAENDSDFTEQLVRIRQMEVTKSTVDDSMLQMREHRFFAFAGKGFDSQILHWNEQLGRQNSTLQNILTVIIQAFQQVYAQENCRSALEVYTTLPRWGAIRFPADVESLGKDYLYRFTSSEVGMMGMMKNAALVNSLGMSPEILKYLFERLEREKLFVGSFPPGSFEDIFSKLQPQAGRTFTSHLIPEKSYLGGMDYSTDGFPHHLDVGPGEKASFRITTLPDSGVRLVRYT